MHAPPASVHAPSCKTGFVWYPVGRPLTQLGSIDTAEPLHPQPTVPAMLQRGPLGAGKHWPTAAQPADSRKPQMPPFEQSASLEQAGVAPASAGGAHWHVSHPLLSLSTPLEHCGWQPRPGHAGPVPLGHAGKPQSHVPLACRVQSVAPMLVPSGHSIASAGAARPAQSAGMQPPAAASPPASVAPDPPGATAPLQPPPPPPVRTATARK
jgi:hypothetical protein